MVIVSKSNPLVKELALLKEKKGREKSGTFLVEGEKMVRECFQSSLKVKRVILREDYAGTDFPVPAVVLGEDAFKAVSSSVTPQSVAAEVFLPAEELRPPKSRALLLDGLQDPQNVGAMIRTAVCAGYDEIYLASCADPFSPKSVRASMSGVFYAKIMRGERDEILSVLAGTPLIAADMAGENVYSFIPPERFVLCLGNEGNGLSEEVASRAEHTVKIPMNGRMESLNVAVAGGILMYELKRNGK